MYGGSFPFIAFRLPAVSVCCFQSLLVALVVLGKWFAWLGTVVAACAGAAQAVGQRRRGQVRCRGLLGVPFELPRQLGGVCCAAKSVLVARHGFHLQKRPAGGCGHFSFHFVACLSFPLSSCFPFVVARKGCAVMSVGDGWQFPCCAKWPEAVAALKGLSVQVGLGGVRVSLQGGAAAAVFGRSEQEGRQERLSEEVGQREGLCSSCGTWCDGCGAGAGLCF